MNLLSIRGPRRRDTVEERQREEKARLFESRREVYLEAAEAIIVAMTCIGRLADLNRVTADILKPYEDQIGNIAKVHLLAGPDVGALVVAIGSEISCAISNCPGLSAGSSHA